MCHCSYYNTFHLFPSLSSPPFPSPLSLIPPLSCPPLSYHLFSSQPTTREPWWHLAYSSALFAKRAFDEASFLPSFPWLKGFWGLFCSWPVGWELLCRDVSPGASVWMSLCGAGLLEGKDCRGRACHHPWIHHDNRNILQGRMNKVAKRQLGDLALWG